MLPAALQQTWERDYPFAWLGILADVAPSTDELIYAWHPDGFAMHSMRSPQREPALPAGRPGRDASRAGPTTGSGPSCRTGWPSTAGSCRPGRSPTSRSPPMRSFVSAPMRHGRLFLAGDAAHIVPPTGAKGLNLAVADVAVLCEALTALLRHGRSELADAYSDTRPAPGLARHPLLVVDDLDAASARATTFDAQLQLSQLRYVTSSPCAAQSLAENYTGMPLH